MSIKENELPIAESLGDGDTLRIVDANGASKRVSADGVGGGSMLLHIVRKENDVFYFDKTWQEVNDFF